MFEVVHTPGMMLIHIGLLDGRGEGFGNKISIQTVAIVKAAKAVGKVYKVDTEHAVRPLSLAIPLSLLFLLPFLFPDRLTHT